MTTEIITLVPLEKTEKVIKLVPPDGGWGWMVVIGTALSNIFNLSMLSLFSLVYGDALEAMGHRTQGAAIVMGTMLFVSNFGGPIAGALVKLTSTRCVAVFGSCLCTSGIFFSGFSTNIWHLVLTYGVLLGMGLGFIQNSSFVAINSYFKIKKSRAVGLANVGTGVGQTLMPHLVRYLLENYGFRGACLLLSSLSFHGVAGTMLLQPVEWHMKKVEKEEIIDESLQLLQVTQKNARGTIVNENDSHKADLPNENGKINVNDKTPIKIINQNCAEINKSHANSLNGTNENKNQKPSFLMKLYDLFGLVLLSDIRFLNTVIGTALMVTSVQNFSMLYPYFLKHVASMDKQQTANCMSAVAGADIAGRLILPYFQDRYKIKARWMLIMTCSWIIVVRQVLAYQSNNEVLIVMSCLYGVGRTMTSVGRHIAISENVRLDQVPSAVGLGMLTMGLMVPPIGYILGWIRDYTGSYIKCITAQNLLLVILLVTWVPDMLYLLLREKKERKILKNAKYLET